MKRLLYSISSYLVIKWWLVPHSVDTSAEAVSGNIESGRFRWSTKDFVVHGDHIMLANQSMTLSRLLGERPFSPQKSSSFMLP